MHRTARLVPLLLAATTVAACGGSTSAGTQPTSGTPGDTVGPSSAASAGTPAGGSVSKPPKRSPGAGGGSAPAAPASRAASAGPVASSAPSQAPGSGSSSAADGMPAAGVYDYRLSGEEKSPLGTRTLSGTSTLTVDAPQGTSQHSQQKDDGGTTDQTVTLTNSGLFLADLKMHQQGFSEEFAPHPPVLLYPVSATTGRHWSWHMTSTDGNYTLRATLTIAKSDGHAVVHGQQLRTVTVRSVLHISGSSITMTIHQTDVAARDGLIVREHAVGDGTAYGAAFHTDTTRVLENSQPHS